MIKYEPKKRLEILISFYDRTKVLKDKIDNDQYDILLANFFNLVAIYFTHSKNNLCVLSSYQKILIINHRLKDKNMIAYMYDKIGDIMLEEFREIILQSKILNYHMIFIKK